MRLNFSNEYFRPILPIIHQKNKKIQFRSPIKYRLLARIP